MFSLRTTPFLEQPDLTLQNGRLAVLCNHAAWHPDEGAYLFELLVRRGNLVRVIMPEHSLYGQVCEGIETVEVTTEVPLKALEGIDGIVVELQDVGSRYSRFTRLLYNLIGTLNRKVKNVSLYIIDRNIPSGRQIEGTMGSFGLPQRHGLTFGEMANMFYSEANARFPIHIIAAGAEAVNKELMPWSIPPFSDFCGLFTSHFYSGQCLWMGTNVSYGHGTTRPFEQFGAPFMESLFNWNERNGFSSWNEPGHPAASQGVLLRWTRFVPEYGIHAGQVCFGFQLMFTPGAQYHAFNHALRLIRFVRDNCPEFRFDGMEKLLEDEALMCYLDGTVDWDVTREYIKAEEQKWLRKSKKYLLYDEAPWRVK